MAFYAQGEYDVEILAQGFGESEKKKTPFLFLTFIPTSYGGDPVDAPYERETRLYLTDNTIDRVMEHLRALGWGGTDFGELEPNGSHSLVGATCKLRCMHDQNGENVYENWEFPAPGGSHSEAVSGLGKKLNALFGKAAKAAGPAKEVAKAAKAEPNFAEGEADEDDVPF